MPPSSIPLLSRTCAPSAEYKRADKRRSLGTEALSTGAAHIAGVDMFVVPTIGFKLLYGLVILGLERRRLV